MVAGVELVSDRATREPFSPAARMGRRAVELLQKRGVLVRALGDTIAMSPPLIFTGSMVEELVAKLEETLDALARELDC